MKFVYNNALSATTSVFSFFANEKYHLNITVHPEHDIAFSWAYDFTIDLDELQSILKAKISAAQQRYQKSADVWCSPAPNFKVGDKVFVKAKFFRTTYIKIKKGRLDLFYFSFHFLSLFQFIFQFFIFRTTRVRVDQSCYHISHLIA